MAQQTAWTIEAYESDQGARPAWDFIRAQSGRNRTEAIALVRTVVLLDGEVKKRDDIPRKTLERVRGYQADVRRRGRATRRKKER